MVEYNKKEWHDESDGILTPITAENLNNIEEGIDICAKGINKIESELTDHYWRKSKVVDAKFNTVSAESNDFHMLGGYDMASYTEDLYYSDSISFEVDNNTGQPIIYLDNPSKVVCGYNILASTGFCMGANKYYIVGSTFGRPIHFSSSGNIYAHYQNDNTLGRNHGYYIANSRVVTSVAIYGDIEYVHSPNIGEYSNGWSEADSALYEYIGIPSNNAKETCRIKIGTYTGTGTYGEQYPVSIPCDGTPKYVKIISVSGDMEFTSKMPAAYYRDKSSHYQYTYINTILSKGENGFVSWYNVTSPNYMANVSGHQYQYMFIF